MDNGQNENGMCRRLAKARSNRQIVRRRVIQNNLGLGQHALANQSFARSKDLWQITLGILRIGPSQFRLVLIVDQIDRAAAQAQDRRQKGQQFLGQFIQPADILHLERYRCQLGFNQALGFNFLIGTA